MLISRGGRRTAASGMVSLGPATVPSSSVSSSVSRSPSSSPSPSGSLSGFFVATTGNDGNAGTEASPWQTIKFALTQVTAGDTVWVRGGTHSANIHQSAFTAWNTGTSFSNPITISAYPSESVSITSQVGYDPPGGSTNFYHIWQDITFSAFTNGAIYGPSSHFIRFEDCIIANADGQGVQQISTSSHWEFLRCAIHDNGFAGINLYHGCYMSGPDNLFEDCDIYDNGSYGIQFYPASTGGNVVRRCSFHGNGSLGAGVDAGALVIYGGTGNKVHNCLIYDNDIAGIDFNNQVSFECYFNAVYNGSHGIAGSSSGGNVKNNICYLTGGIAGGGCTTSNNVTSDPSWSNPAGANFHLTAGSSNCINQGTAIAGITDDYDLVTRGTPPDIGPYEF